MYVIKDELDHLIILKKNVQKFYTVSCQKEERLDPDPTLPEVPDPTGSPDPQHCFRL
jgi:hypothetical protein